ncbi:restriction endonuclease subunit S [Phreatobacter oligotrophus]|uniref:Restriction endonuclease S subunit n=1 Tax=Phreatobacter oligotrophus TaxID=1122261 RepID=A0A2T4ZDW3_9HYPH|nr:restriction endonuclease subunit S [Phreatobacter oligotrophus]PTM60086.1 restriction endonuclease S subunit [Phreatobacter oligotrophus]
MADRVRRRLGEIADLNWGDTNTTKASYTPTGFLAFSATGPDGFLPYHDFDRIGVVLSAIGANCGQTWLARGKWSCIKNTIRFWSKSPDADTEFLYWYTRNPDFWPRRGSAQPFISQGDARSLFIDLPDPSTQKAIASVLGALDDKIELNRRMNETLEAMARAIFKDWFIDFGPTRAKMEGRAPYLAPDIWSLFPDRFDEEGKPEGWEMAKLSDFMHFQGGTQPPASEFIDKQSEGYVRLLQIRDFYTSSHITFIRDTDRLRKVHVDDICIGRYGSGTGDEKDSLGRMCRGLTGAINVALVAVEPLFNCREWLATYIGSGDFRRAVSGGSSRAVQAGFRQSDLAFVSVVRATAEVHNAFEAIGTLVWERKKSSISENETLAATRDFLLPKLMSGEVRVRESEKLLGEAI